jgi:hypothetical protein
LEDICRTPSDIEDEKTPWDEKSVDELFVHVKILAIFSLGVYLGYHVEVT